MVDESTNISTLVRERLAGHPFDNVEIRVLDELIRRDNGWWYVPVQASERLSEVNPYYELLATVEEELDESGLNVLLVPTLPE